MGGAVCVACVYACRVVCECAWAAVAMLSCVTDVEGFGVCVWAPGTDLDAEAAAALADPLGKLVHLTSLDLWCMWHGGVGCVSRVCMHGVPCPSVRGRLWQCGAV